MRNLTQVQRNVIQQQVRDCLTMLRALSPAVRDGDPNALVLDRRVRAHLERLDLGAVFADRAARQSAATEETHRADE